MNERTILPLILYCDTTSYLSLEHRCLAALRLSYDGLGRAELDADVSSYHSSESRPEAQRMLAVLWRVWR
jgi:hypothetical protein